MTNRQTALARRVRAHAGEIVTLAETELAPRPVGTSVLARLPLRFEPFARYPTNATMILVTKLPTGYQWQEYDPPFFNRKGREQPKPRRL
jgi:hypothetical protein